MGVYIFSKNILEDMDYAKENTDLPEKPDYKKINDFVMDVNERIVKGEV